MWDTPVLPTHSIHRQTLPPLPMAEWYVGLQAAHMRVSQWLLEKSDIATLKDMNDLYLYMESCINSLRYDRGEQPDALTDALNNMFGTPEKNSEGESAREVLVQRNVQLLVRLSTCEDSVVRHNVAIMSKMMLTAHKLKMKASVC